MPCLLHGRCLGQSFAIRTDVTRDCGVFTTVYDQDATAAITTCQLIHSANPVKGFSTLEIRHCLYSIIVSYPPTFEFDTSRGFWCCLGVHEPYNLIGQHLEICGLAVAKRTEPIALLKNLTKLL